MLLVLWYTSHYMYLCSGDTFWPSRSCLPLLLALNVSNVSVFSIIRYNNIAQLLEDNRDTYDLGREEFRCECNPTSYRDDRSLHYDILL